MATKLAYTDDINPATLRAIFKHCSKKMQKPFPTDDYLVFDTETSGLDNIKNRILQVGFAYVKDRKVTDSVAKYVKVPPGTVSHSHDDEETGERIKGSVDINGITEETLEKYGESPVEVFGWVKKMFLNAKNKGLPLVGHNSVRFDIPFIMNELDRHNVGRVELDNDLIIDTGILVKGARISYVPRPEQNLKKLWYDISLLRMKGVFYSIDWCFKHFKLDETRGASKIDQHDAAADAVLTHHILESLRDLVGDAV